MTKEWEVTFDELAPYKYDHRSSSVWYTVKPLKSGHIGGRTLVGCGEVPISEVD